MGKAREGGGVEGKGENEERAGPPMFEVR